MQPLVSAADRQLLLNYNIQIDVDVGNKNGIIIYKDRRFKVSLLNRKSGEADAQWETLELKEEQLRETANKVAVMLLKKELLQTDQDEPLHLKINQPGITCLSDHDKLIKHEDAEETKNTRPDYDALISYLTQPEKIGDEVQDFENDLYDELLDDKLKDQIEDNSTDSPKKELTLLVDESPISASQLRASPSLETKKKKAKSKPSVISPSLTRSPLTGSSHSDRMRDIFFTAGNQFE